MAAVLTEDQKKIITKDRKAVADARVALLTGKKSILARVEDFKNENPKWYYSSNTTKLIETLQNFKSELEEFLNALAKRIDEYEKDPEPMTPRILGISVARRENPARIDAVIELLKHLEKIPDLMAPLVYSKAVEAAVSENPSSQASYAAARKMIDEFASDLLTNQIIYGLVWAVELTPSTLTTLKVSPWKALGSGAVRDQEQIDACLDGLIKCHLEGMKRTDLIETLFKVMLQQIITPATKEKLRKAELDKQLSGLKERLSEVTENISFSEEDESQKAVLIATKENIEEQIREVTNEIKNSKYIAINKNHLGYIARNKMELPVLPSSSISVEPEPEDEFHDIETELSEKTEEEIEDKFYADQAEYEEEYEEELRLSTIEEEKETEEEEEKVEEKNFSPPSDLSLEGEFEFIEKFYNEKYLENKDQSGVSAQRRIENYNRLPKTFKTVTDYFVKLDNYLNTLPAYMRSYLQRQIDAVLFALKGTLPSDAPSKLIQERTPSRLDDDNSPLIIHIAGTEMSATTQQDVLGNVIADYKNYMIEAGPAKVETASDGPDIIKKIITNLLALKAKNQLPQYLKLVGFSRGAALQFELANVIHKTFNTSANSKDWITIDMFLVDPAYGVFDKDDKSATRTENIPPCVHTCNILTATGERSDEETEKLQDLGTRQREVHKLVPESKFIKIQTLALKGKHRDLGLLREKGMGYFVGELFRAFLNNSGCKTADGSTEIGIPDFNEKYIKKNFIQKQQDLSAYTPSHPARSESEKNSLLFSDYLAKLAQSTLEPSVSVFDDKELQFYYDELNKIAHGIVYGKYSTHFFINTSAEEKNLGLGLPKHMSEMYVIIQDYFDKKKDPKVTFQRIRDLAKVAVNKKVTFSRDPRVASFYKKIADTPDLMTKTDLNVKNHLIELQENSENAEISEKIQIILRADLSQGVGEIKLKELKEFIKEKSPDSTLIEKITDKQNEIEAKRVGNFNNISQQVLNIVEPYKKFDSFVFGASNQAEYKKLTDFINTLHQEKTPPPTAAEKLALLTHYIDQQLDLAKTAQADTPKPNKPSTVLTGYQKYVQTQSGWMELLKQAKDKIAELNHKDNDPIFIDQVDVAKLSIGPNKKMK